MRLRVLFFFTLVSCALFFSSPTGAYAENVTLYTQSDDSGEMLSQQATYSNTWIPSESLGNVYLGKERLTLTFTMKDPHARAGNSMPQGVALGSCSNCKTLQKYYFTDADRALLSDGEFHTFTVETGTTTMGTADGETPVFITFFGLSQYHLGTHLKSNAAGTIPYLKIEAAAFPPPPDNPQAPLGSVTVYEQTDKTSIMSNPQASSQNSYIDSASLGNLDIGQGPLYLTFTMKSPYIYNPSRMPQGICLEPATSHSCGTRLQTYYFTDADRTLLSDGAFHTFTVLTGTTTNMYADGTKPVSMGFFGLYQIQYATKVKSNADASIPFLTIKKPDPCIAAGTCASNVLFLPGIESSRLYRPNYNGGTDKLWEPNIDSDVQELYMNPDGTSKRFDVYTKERDVLDELPDGENIYKSFITKMDDLKTNGTILDWEPIAYDWRLSLDDILNYGHDVQRRIYYSGDLRATSTPYIIQELKHLAATSKTGKVTIVAHSNGGLLAKRLTEVLGPTEASRLIDKMLFVAVPQAGTPAAVAAGLHGYDQEHAWGFVTSKNTARTLAVDAPMTYQLLPSASYFTYVDTPVVTFDSSLTDWIAHYGDVIHSQERLLTFLLDTFGRVDPQSGDINQPTQFNSSLLGNAETLHTTLDTWAPPSGVQLTQIAGWGIPKTVDGIIYKKKGSGVTPEPDLTVDGDGTVVVPSALWTSTTTGAVNYWVDLKSYNKLHVLDTLGGLRPFSHGNILETDSTLNFISDQIINITKPISDYSYLSTEVPIQSGRRLQYSLHSPLTLNLYDAVGHHTGVSTTTGQVEEQIPGTYYLEFGDVKYVFSDTSTDGNIFMDGYDSGTFTFSVDEYTGDTLTTSTTFKDVPTTASTTVSLSVQSGGLVSAMTVDENGDGGNVFTLTPIAGETVIYEPPVPDEEPAPTQTSSGGGAYSEYVPAGSISIPFITPFPITIPVLFPVELVATTSASLTTTSVEAVATTTEDVVEIKKSTPVLARADIKIEKEEVPKDDTTIPQTASAHDAFQQPFLQKLAGAVYTGMRGLWSVLMRFF